MIITGSFMGKLCSDAFGILRGYFMQKKNNVHTSQSATSSPIPHHYFCHNLYYQNMPVSSGKEQSI